MGAEAERQRCSVHASATRGAKLKGNLCGRGQIARAKRAKGYNIPPPPHHKGQKLNAIEILWQVTQSPHIDFHMRWAEGILLNHGSHIMNERSTYSASLRGEERGGAGSRGGEGVEEGRQWEDRGGSEMLVCLGELLLLRVRV